MHCMQKEVHSLFVMFHGSIRPSLLDKEPSGVLIRSHLYPFITDFLKWCANIHLFYILVQKLQDSHLCECVSSGTAAEHSP